MLFDAKNWNVVRPTGNVEAITKRPKGTRADGTPFWGETAGIGGAAKFRERLDALVKGNAIPIPQSRLDNALKSKNEFAKFEKELRMCNVAVQNGHSVEMLEEIPGVSSCDILLDGKRTELKAINSASNIYRYAKRAIKGQGAVLVLFEFGRWGAEFEAEIGKLSGRDIHGYYYIKGSDILNEF